MKTLCAAVVVLSLISVCRPASPTCEQLLKALQKSPDLSGRWYYVAMSTELCLPLTLVKGLLSPSLALDVSPKTTANIIETRLWGKFRGFCVNETESFHVKDNEISDVDSNNAPTGQPDLMLHTSCPDCIVIKKTNDDFIDAFVLLSRRTSVSAEEIQEFEAQAKCLGWSKPQLFNTDHDYENCISVDDDPTTEQTVKLMERMANAWSSGQLSAGLKSLFIDTIKCFEHMLRPALSSLLNSAMSYL